MFYMAKGFYFCAYGPKIYKALHNKPGNLDFQYFRQARELGHLPVPSLWMNSAGTADWWSHPSVLSYTQQVTCYHINAAHLIVSECCLPPFPVWVSLYRRFLETESNSNLVTWITPKQRYGIIQICINLMPCRNHRSGPKIKLYLSHI